jgi:hypothetical protein
MSNPFAMILVSAAVSILVAVAGCGNRHDADNQAISSPDSTPAARESASVEATLRQAPGTRHLEIEIKNIGNRPFTFLDIREGSACCDEFWDVEVRMPSGRPLKQNMVYSAEGLPDKVSIEPGKTYLREIQPGAYVDYRPGKAEEEGTVIIRYRVKHPSDWQSVLPPPYPTFSTQPLKGKLTNYLFH